jgi:hypothetical protein
MRQNYLFTSDAPPIVSLEDVLKDLDRPSHRDLVQLTKAIEMCNLATLAFATLRPDDCWSLAPTYKPSRKGKERASEMSMRVAQRNEVLLELWENFWMILSDDVKGKEDALSLWVDMATQVSWLCPSRRAPRSS